MLYQFQVLFSMINTTYPAVAEEEFRYARSIYPSVFETAIAWF
jgi:hypothetical protein